MIHFYSCFSKLGSTGFLWNLACGLELFLLSHKSWLLQDSSFSSFHFHVCMDTGVHGTRWLFKVEVGHYPLLFYLTQQGTTLSLNPEPVDMASLSSRVLRGSRLCLQWLESQAGCHTHLAFTLALGSRSPVLLLAQQVLWPQSHLFSSRTNNL